MAYEIDVKFTEKNAEFKADFGNVEFLPVRIMPATRDTLGGIKVGDGLEITPDGTLSTDKPILWNTTEYWNTHRDIVALEGVMYVYNDYKVIEDVKYSNFKIGDGVTYLVDLPFNSIDQSVIDTVNMLEDKVDGHIAQTDAHVSAIDREIWNNKVTANISEENPETLLLSKS